MSLIKAENLTFSYPGCFDPVFENACFQLDTDWKLGFVGRNGKGKTTFLNLLLGRYPYSGVIRSSVRFSYFPFGVDDPENPAFDVVREIANGAEDWQILRELSLLSVAEEALYQPFSTLSQGEQTKLLLAALFLRENEFLLIDEPTNHLDDETRTTLCSYLNRKKGFILVSHDRHFLDGCVDHILAINRANIEVQKGNFSTWYQNKLWQDGFETARNEKLKKSIAELEAAAKQRACWSDRVEKSKFNSKNSGSKVDRGYVGHKAAKMMRSAQNLERRQQAMLEEKKGLLQNVDEQTALTLYPLTYRESRVARISDLSVSYGGRQILTGFGLEICAGERVALQGRNGSGKSSILKLLLGETVPHTGTVALASGVKISSVPQSTEGLSGSLADFAEAKGVDYTLLLTLLRKLGLSKEQFPKNIGAFSAGQKKNSCWRQALPSLPTCISGMSP